MHQEENVIIGIDPGTRVTGYGIIRITGNSYQLIDYGCIKPPPDLKLTDRYHIIFQGLDELLQKYKATCLSVETQFVQKNIQSALKLGMATGVVIVAAKIKGLPVYRYTPTQAKKAVVGNGRASKSQVQSMVARLLSLSSLPEPEDAADALAIAICHAHSIRSRQLIGAEI